MTARFLKLDQITPTESSLEDREATHGGQAQGCHDGPVLPVRGNHPQPDQPRPKEAFSVPKAGAGLGDTESHFSRPRPLLVMQVIYVECPAVPAPVESALRAWLNLRLITFEGRFQTSERER